MPCWGSKCSSPCCHQPHPRHLGKSAKSYVPRTAVLTVWGSGSTFREERHGDWLEEFHLPDDPVSSDKCAIASGVWTVAKMVQDDRVPPFEDFWIGDSSVGHVAMDSRRSVPAGSCTAASGNGLWSVKSGQRSHLVVAPSFADFASDGVFASRSKTQAARQHGP